jgi:uncharacterized protein (TIGR00106 family)
MSVIVDLAIFPMDKGGSVSDYVSRAVKIIKGCGLSYQFGPMGTAVEGEWDEVMNVVGRCFRALERDSERVYMTLKIDYKKGSDNRITTKVKSVEDKLKAS